MTFMDLVVSYVLLSGLFILAVIVSALWRVACQWFGDALNGIAEDIR